MAWGMSVSRSSIYFFTFHLVLLRKLVPLGGSSFATVTTISVCVYVRVCAPALSWLVFLYQSEALPWAHIWSLEVVHLSWVCLHPLLAHLRMWTAKQSCASFCRHMVAIMHKTNLISLSEDHQEYVINFRIQRQHTSCCYLLLILCAWFLWGPRLALRYHCCPHTDSNRFTQTHTEYAVWPHNQYAPQLVWVIHLCLTWLLLKAFPVWLSMWSQINYPLIKGKKRKKERKHLPFIPAFVDSVMFFFALCLYIRRAEGTCVSRPCKKKKRLSQCPAKRRGDQSCRSVPNHNMGSTLVSRHRAFHG